MLPVYLLTYNFIFVGLNDICTGMFQGNDASSRWTATQQMRRKTDPIVWMCSVQQQA